jgi:phosphonopyruvate decarboxylase
VITRHARITVANEGNAIALAAGYHLATKKIGLVYMQNSGLGNAANPLVSLADKEVYSIPMLIIIGWRGEPGIKDEPQHVTQGKITKTLLKTLDIPYSILPDTLLGAQKELKKALGVIKKQSVPYAIVVKQRTFLSYNPNRVSESLYHLSREEALKLAVDQLSTRDIVVSTTGKVSRELFEYRETLHQDHSKDFLTVGSMGHSSQIALGIAQVKPSRDVYCLDGDGALIMHMGALVTIGASNAKNLKHIIFNNGAHDSVGGQPTAGFNIDIPSIAKACGYQFINRAESTDEIIEKLIKLKSVQGPALLEIRVRKGARKDLGRPTTSPVENKQAFMKFLEATA